jgi:hypothetical protein
MNLYKEVAKTAFCVSPIISTPMTIQHTYTYDVFISHSPADLEWVQVTLAPRLEQAGLNVVIGSRDFLIGVPELTNIDHAVEQSRCVLLVLTPEWVGSEWSAFEGMLAQTRGLVGRRWHVLPILLRQCDLPMRIAALNHVDFTKPATWEREMERLLRQVLDPAPSNSPPREQSIRPPKAYAETSFIKSLREPSGTEPTDSAFYIRRDDDELFERELDKEIGTTTIIRAPRQTGKSSLLVRGLSQAVKRGSGLIFVDMQQVGLDDLRSLDAFLRYLAVKTIKKLGLNLTEFEQEWTSMRSSQDKLTFFFEDNVFRGSDRKVVLAIDEADRLLDFRFCNSFFALLRSWHENRARSMLTDGYWVNLDMALVISTDPNLMISDTHQSPFNVGTEIYLDDFDMDQVRELNIRYRSPVEDRHILHFAELLDGHPYLTRKALYTMINRKTSWDELTKIAISPKGPFRNHLKHYETGLQNHVELKNELKHILKYNKCLDPLMFNRLLQSGLVKGEPGNCRCRCKLYSDYLKDKI